VIVPAAALYIGLGRPIIVTLLQRGAFNASDASIVADTLTAFAVGLLPFSIYLFSLRVFYARHDTYTPFWINCIENGVNIALAFPLYAWLGVPGLALSFALAYLLAAGIALGVLHGRLHGIDGARITGTIVRTGFAGIAVGAVSWGVANLIGWSTTTEAVASVVAGTVAGALVYLALLAALRVDELTSVLALVPGLRSRSRSARPGSRV
jgi:putative peptidoglycan lipid II flippase